MGQKLSVCFGRTLIIHDVKNCQNPGKFARLSVVFSWMFLHAIEVLRPWKIHWVQWTRIFAFFSCTDCDPNQKQSTTTELEGLVNRLERLVDRLERSVSARELEYTNHLLCATQQAASEAVQSALGHTTHQRRPDAPLLQRGATIEEDTLKSLSNNNSLSDNLVSDNSRPAASTNEQLPTVLPESGAGDSTSSSTSLKQRICKLEDSVNNQINRTDDDLLSSGQIPTVVENMSVYAYQDIVSGPLAQFLALSTKIGGDVATQADFVRKAFE